LHENILNTELGFFNYSIYRCDRNPFNSSKLRGGGVLIAVNNKLFSTSINIDNNILELVLVSVKINVNTKIIIGSVYFPPNSSINLYSSFFDIIENIILLFPNDKLWLFGDFNLPNLSTYNSCDFSSKETMFLEKLSLLNLSQINPILNCNNNTLDLILSNSLSSLITLNPDFLVPIDKYHPPLSVELLLNTVQSSLSFCEHSYDWKNGDYHSIIAFLGSFNWSNFFKLNSNINILVDEFYSLLFFTINLNIPKKNRFSSHKFPIWYSSNLKNLLKQKNIAHALFKYSNSHTNYLKSSTLRAKCKSQSKKDYSLYLSNTETLLKNNPKRFWSFLKSIKSSSDFPCTLSLNDVVANDGQGIVDLFGSYFSSVYKKSNIFY
jgi:hypothetical protein